MLEGKRLLIVDDEPDIIETLIDLLPQCNVVTASTYEAAAQHLTSADFDLALLDIMGVNGYALLELANSRRIPAVMLTAHALTPEDTVKSFRKGAAYFIPKDELADIETFLNDVLEARRKKRNPWQRWLERFSPFYQKRFGGDWQNRDKAFWDGFIERYRNW